MRLSPSALWVLINLHVGQEICLDPRGSVLNRESFITVMDQILKISTEEVNPVFVVGDNQLVITSNKCTSKHFR